MILKYNIEIDNDTIYKRLKVLINQIYKLLPNREQGVDWKKPLYTIIQELAGIYRLTNCGYSEIFFPLFNKLEGLYSLEKQADFLNFRRSVFECLNLMSLLQEELCQNQKC